MPALVQARREGSLPLSFAQQRLWFLDQLEPGSPFYNIPAAFQVDGPLDVDALQRSFSELVRRHEALRTTFATAGGEPVQVISPPKPFEPAAGGSLRARGPRGGGAPAGARRTPPGRSSWAPGRCCARASCAWAGTSTCCS